MTGYIQYIYIELYNHPLKSLKKIDGDSQRFNQHGNMNEIFLSSRGKIKRGNPENHRTRWSIFQLWKAKGSQEVIPHDLLNTGRKQSLNLEDTNDGTLWPVWRRHFEPWPWRVLVSPRRQLAEQKMRSDVIGIPNDLPEFLSDSKRNVILHNYFRLTTVHFVLLIQVIHASLCLLIESCKSPLVEFQHRAVSRCWWGCILMLIVPPLWFMKMSISLSWNHLDGFTLSIAPWFDVYPRFIACCIQGLGGTC
jgi:hypothetical protein